MICERFKLPDGTVGIMCSRGRRARKCRFCGGTASLQCDYPLTGKRAGKTCDANMCRSCGVQQASTIEGDTVDYCPPHARATAQDAAQTSRSAVATPAAAPHARSAARQTELFEQDKRP